MCPGNTKIQYARMIEPLDQVTTPILPESDSNRSLSLSGSISRNTTSSSSVSYSTSQSGDALRSPVTPASFTPGPGLNEIGSNQSAAIYSEGPDAYLARAKGDPFLEKQKIKGISRELKSVKLPISGGSIFRRGSSREAQLPQQPRFCFSASGEALLLWGAGSNWLIRFETSSVEAQKPISQRYDVSGVQYAAAGDQRCAVIAAVGEVRPDSTASS